MAPAARHTKKTFDSEAQSTMTQPTIESGRTGQCDWTRLRVAGAMMEIIPARGALLSQWQVARAGQPMPVLWLSGDAYDAPFGPQSRLMGGMPLLFPVAGPTLRDGQEGRYLVEGAAYTMPGHGFASKVAWTPDSPTVSAGEAAMTLRLTDTPETRKTWPFAFESTVTYRLRERSLRTEWRVRNLSATPAPMAPGLHPYFHLPFTDKGRRADVLVHTFARNHYVLSLETRCWSGQTTPLPNYTLRLGNLPSGRSFMVGDLERPEYVVEDPASGVRVRAEWPAPKKPGDGPYLNFWTSSDEVPMFCVEPFMTPTNALNHRHGLIEVAPGDEWAWWFEMRVE